MTGTNAVATTTSYMHADHLGSTNVVTDENGTVVQTLDYYPFGSKRISSGTDVSQREFIGQIEDPETSMNYLNARYLQNNRGQFISQDPMFWSLPSQLLADPQQQNSYSYARNNPIGMSDPSGLKTIIVPGTGYNKKDWNKKGKAGDFIRSVEKTFGEPADILKWSGKDTKKARTEAAKMLSEMIEGHDFAEGELLNIVGHSHGGNIGIEYSKTAERKIDNLVTLGTPARSDYQPNYTMISNHINVYSNFDPVQVVLGGSGGYAGPGPIGSVNRIINHFKEFGPAGRKYDDATNMSVTRAAGLIPFSAHTNLWQNSGVWSSVDSLINQ